MKYSYAFALAAAQLASAHTTFQSFVIDGKDQGHHFAVRTPSNGNNPILDVTSSAMTCNGGVKAADTLEVAGDAKITFQWHHNDPQTSTDDKDEPIAASHKGPIMVYIAPAASNGEGAVWTKLAADGLTNGKWAVEDFMANKGQHSVTLPGLAAGEYLIRPEIIALHEGNRAKGAQFYNGCGQIKVTGSGSKTLPATGVDMTKAYSATDAGVLFDIYAGKTSYPMPGPAVWDGVSGSGSSGSGSSAAPKPTATSAPAATSAAAEATPSKTAAASAAPAPTSGSGSGSGSSTLPEEFTLNEFIAWLKTTTGASSKARRHARSFF
ncbi:hypothetical protein E8E13_004529 [Curvularia kusanoi]|uniref:AA9 family lytic polysaccharide monooxygenase n=1 Tax=Curvularia kusanoi TaxID=90978 RepID=A0A9P4W4B2_CURKU|nr:hypothetical protein E8E13_004529 [Curvularia kusanoi]